MNTTVLRKGNLLRALYVTLAIAGGVCLPQIFHALGVITGLGASVGQTLLPMHIPVFFAGMLMGKREGAVVGLVSPVVSFLLSGMPTAYMLPFMVIELAAYGWFSGFFAEKKMGDIANLVLAMLIGRALRMAVMASAVALFSFGGFKPSFVLTGVTVGWPGIILQLLLIPTVMAVVRSKR